MWRAQRQNLGSAGIRRLIYTLLLAGIACSDSGTDVVQVEGLRFVTQPATIGAGVPMTVTVELLSGDGSRITSATDQVTLSASGGATLGGTTTVAAAAGLATFSGITLSSLGQNIQLTARVGDISATSTTFSVTAGPASAQQSTMTVPTNVTANANATLTFTFRDALNNALGNVPVSFSTNLAGATFTPASGTTDANGAFSTVFRATSSGSAAITVNVGGTSITFPTNITVAAGAGALRFVAQPVNVAAGAAFSVSVEVLDNTGQRLTTATNPITLTLSAGTIQGTATANAVAGLATFNGLSINGAAAGTIMTATSGTLTVQSNPFNITAGAAALAQSTVTFAPAFSNGVASVATFTFRDAFSNPVANAAVSLSSSIAGTTFSQATGTTSATGVFTSTITPGALGAGTITAIVGGTSLVFNVASAGPCVVGDMTLGTPVAGTLASSSGCSLGTHVASSFRFSMPSAATPTAMTLSGTGTGFFPEVGVSLDPPNSSTIVCPQGTTPTATIACEWLLPSGASYRALIASSTGGTGAFTLTSTPTGTGLAGCRAKIILGVTQAYVGQGLATTDCGIVDDGQTYYTDFFFLADPRPCVIRLQAGYPVYLQLDFENGAASQVVQGQTDHSLTLASCAPGGGQILINASSFASVVTGAYTLTVTLTGTNSPDGAELRHVSRDIIIGALPTMRMGEVFGHIVRHK